MILLLPLVLLQQFQADDRSSQHRADWFGGLTILLEDNGDTVLTGPVVDQAALYGLLRKVRDLGMPLLSLNRLNPNLGDAPDVK